MYLVRDGYLERPHKVMSCRGKTFSVRITNRHASPQIINDIQSYYHRDGVHYFLRSDGELVGIRACEWDISVTADK